jgi:hypothetical protein
VIGNPGLGRGEFKLENAVAKGIASTEVDLPMGRFFQLNININPGNSGGPVFDSFGRVLGMVQSRSTFEEGIAFAVPTEDLAKALAAAQARSSAEKNQLSSQCNARAIFLRTAKSARLYNIGNRLLETAWQDAIARSGSVRNSDLDTARNNFISSAANQKQDFLLDVRDVSVAITSIGSDKNHSEPVRTRLADLWQVAESSRRDFVDTAGNLFQFRTRNDQHMFRIEELTESLRINLGVSPEEINVLTGSSK